MMKFNIGTPREATGPHGRPRDPTPGHQKSLAKLISYTTNIARTPTEQALFGELLTFFSTLFFSFPNSTINFSGARLFCFLLLVQFSRSFRPPYRALFGFFSGSFQIPFRSLFGLLSDSFWVPFGFLFGSCWVPIDTILLKSCLGSSCRQGVIYTKN